MEIEKKVKTNVKQAVPFFGVAKMQDSIRFYVDGLGFEITKKWVVEDQLRWCWLEIGNAALMLQEYKTEGHDSWTPEGKVGIGVNICFQCEDALEIYRDARAHGLHPSKPFVGNGMWVTTLRDPDGYRIDFESLTDVPEESEYSEEE